MLDVLITPVKCLQGRTYNGVWMSTQDANISAWSLEFCRPQPISVVILLGVEVTVTLHLPQGSMLLKLCPAFWSLQLAHLLGIVHTNIGCCSAPTLASKGQCDAFCELKYLCRRVHWGATSGGSAGRMAGDDSSYRGVSPLAKGELGRSSIQPCQWRWYWAGVLSSSLRSLPFQAGENPRLNLQVLSVHSGVVEVVWRHWWGP